MAQYIEIKSANPDCLLFYRMGDFYELFFEDAVVASRALSIALTKRGKHRGEDIPMAGVPVARGDEYLQKLIQAGYRVAVCEQTEDPAEARKRGSKAVVRREVVRLVTPGTLTEDNLLDAARNNFLLALFPHAATTQPSPGVPGHATAYALAAVDISTGDFCVGTVAAADLAGELVRLDPGEVLLADHLARDALRDRAIGMTRASATPVPAPYFDSATGTRDLKERLGLADLESLGGFTRPELAAIAAVLRYVELTQLGASARLREPVRFGTTANLVMDAATRRNLELERTISGERRGSLLAAIDRTVTPGGARELARRLSAPLRDPSAIAARLDAVDFLLTDARLREGLRGVLRGAPDVPRAVSRLALSRGGPRDLGAVRDALHRAVTAGDLLVGAAGLAGLPEALSRIAAILSAGNRTLADELQRALADELPIARRDGGFVREGFRAELDENRLLRDRSRQVLAELQTRYQTETGVASLKVRHNNMLGYFIELTQTHGERFLKPPLSERFRHRQTLVSALRFSTDELESIEGRITAAAERTLAIEQEVFAELANFVGAEADRLAALADALAELDVHAGLAELASERNYVRPSVVEGLAFEIEAGRHPVVEQAQAAAREAPFIANDCMLGLAAPSAPSVPGPRQATSRRRSPSKSAGALPQGPLPEQPLSAASAQAGPGFDETLRARILVMTGPNMSGKSTYLRQNALIAILAQMGSFVPAERARIGVVDRVFSRVGASDDLARGRSTFMVEMVETAAILHQAGEHSLVILDEIGRGTSTFDGLSIAWATIEHLHSVNRCRALFATHYHELTALAGRLPGVANATIDVREWKDEIVFLHRVVPGAADRSYGIQVAKLAGLPSPVIARAREILQRLEAEGARPDPAALVADLPLFAATTPNSAAPSRENTAPEHPALVLLRSASPDELTPREALELLYRLRELTRDGSPSDRERGG
ncbi:MAG: DNA mismatch repair protein MutS [Rhizobiales bacterium]|nr:DNA mismatch repair protein MutS [Hyphomicrobiales bacterium]